MNIISGKYGPFSNIALSNTKCFKKFSVALSWYHLPTTINHHMQIYFFIKYATFWLPMAIIIVPQVICCPLVMISHKFFSFQTCHISWIFYLTVANFKILNNFIDIFWRCAGKWLFRVTSKVLDSSVANFCLVVLFIVIFLPMFFHQKTTLFHT